MEKKIKDLLLTNSMALFGSQIEENQIQFQITRKDVEGDFTLVTFPFSKLMRCSPADAATKIGDFLKSQLAEIEKFEVINGFLNICLNDSYWIEQLNEIQKSENFGFSAPNSKPLYMVEYSSPNTNKPLHLGHLRNIFLGYSVSEILKANGHKVIKTQVINDRGIHICKSMLAWEKFSPLNSNGERETPSNTGLKGDKLVGKYYVEFDKHFNEEANQIIEKWNIGNFEGFSNSTKEEFLKFQSAKEGKDEKAVQAIDSKIKDLAKNQTTILLEAKEMLIKWEARDPQVYLLWSTMNGWVYEGFASTYKKMGVDFDKLYYESDTFLLGKDVVLQGIKDGIFYKKEDGSVWIDLTNEGLDEKLVLRSDGTAVYMTQDIGTAIDRFKDFPDLNGMVYTVGNEQDYHFKVLFFILKKLGYQWANNCFHLSYGMVDLPTGKMKSREGTVVDADDLMDEVIEKATEITHERGHLEGMSHNDKTQLFSQIGLGGLKYYLLKVDPKKRMMFNPEESIDLNGNTGPFIQYTFARIQSLLSKAGYQNEINNLDPYAISEEEKLIIKTIKIFPDTIDEAAKTYSPALIANFVYELVKNYNHFYQSVKILTEENKNIKNARLTISSEAAKTIQKCLNLLGIEAPKRM
jgi:arginyl-tRNA synthetase